MNEIQFSAMSLQSHTFRKVGTETQLKEIPCVVSAQAASMEEYSIGEMYFKAFAARHAFLAHLQQQLFLRMG